MMSWKKMLSLCKAPRAAIATSHQIPASSSLSGKGSLEGSSLSCILIADGFAITILFASSLLCPFVDNGVTACQCSRASPGLLGWGGFVLFCFPCHARRPWYFCIWQRVCVRRGWCVSDRSRVMPPGSSWSDWFEVESSLGHTENGCHWAFLSSLFIYFLFPFLKFFHSERGFAVVPHVPCGW